MQELALKKTSSEIFLVCQQLFFAFRFVYFSQKNSIILEDQIKNILRHV